MQLLSDVVRASMITEESINHHLDGLIQETSRAESGVDISGFGRAARRLSPERGHSPDRSGRKHSPERDRGFKSFFSFRKSPKKGECRNCSFTYLFDQALRVPCTFDNRPQLYLENI